MDDRTDSVHDGDFKNIPGGTERAGHNVFGLNVDGNASFGDLFEQDITELFIKNSSYYISCSAIGREHYYWAFLISSGACPIVLWLALFIWEYVKKLRTAARLRAALKKGWTEETDPTTILEDSVGVYDLVFTSKRWFNVRWSYILEREANRIVNPQTFTGRVWAIAAFFVAMVSFGVYLTETSDAVTDLEICRPWSDTDEWKVDFTCNLFFLVYFILRFTASSRKKWFVTEMYSVVDYCTIPPAFLTLAWNRNWSGLRFMRILHVFAIPDVLQYMGMLKTRTPIRIIHLVSRLAGVVFVFSGIFHLCENSPKITESGHSYWKYLYFSIVTLSTVGYGDISPRTMWGRLFDCIFILTALGLFASSLPDIVNMLSVNYKYGGSFKPEVGIQHVVVCGHISYSVASQLLENFFHPMNDTSFLCIVFISNDNPDVEMESMFRKYFPRVEYFQGDVLSKEDVQRVGLERALACMIISDKKPESTETEDATNVLRVISMKNSHPKTRIIVQMYHKKNHIHLTNLSSWNSLRGDTVVSMSGIKMGLLAKSCIAPGFSTMVSNLMKYHPDVQYLPSRSMQRDSHGKTALEYYLQTCQSQLLLQKLSDYYTDMAFGDAARHCYSRLGILLIGLFEKPASWAAGVEFGEIMINPSSIAVTANHMGIFIAESQEEVDRSWFFCEKCHGESGSPYAVGLCPCNYHRYNPFIKTEKNPVRKFWLNCRRHASQTGNGVQPSVVRTIWQGADFKVEEQRESVVPEVAIKIPDFVPMEPAKETEKPGSLNVVPPEIAAVLAEAPKSALSPALSGTEIRLMPSPVPSSNEIDRLGKYHWIPTRTFQEAKVTDVKSKLAVQHRLENHIVVCVFAKHNASPLDLSEFVMPLRSGDIPLDELKEIVFMGNTMFLEKEWPSLNNFPKITVAKGNPMERIDLELIALNQCDTCVVMQSRSGHSKDEIMDDREAILATLNMKAMKVEEDHRRLLKRTKSTLTPPDPDAYGVGRREIITNIEHDQNVQFLERERSSSQKDVPLHLTDSYISGSVFLESVLDALLITSYFQPLSCSLIRSMVHGRAQMGVMSAKTASGTSVTYVPCPTVEQGLLKVINMTEEIFSSFIGGPYKNIVLEAFAHGMACLGVARTEIQSSHGQNYRMLYPVVNPPGDLIMREDDDVYVFASYIKTNNGTSRLLDQPSGHQMGCRKTVLMRRPNVFGTNVFVDPEYSSKPMSENIKYKV